MDTTAILANIQAALLEAVREYVACPTDVYRARLDVIRELEGDTIDLITEHTEKPDVTLDKF